MFETIVAFFCLPVVLVCLAILFSIVCIIAAENDTHGFAIFFTLVAALVYSKYIIAFFANWQLSLLCIAAYGVIGGLWSVWRWMRYCKKTVEYTQRADNSEKVHYGWKDGGKTVISNEEYLQEILAPNRHKSRLIGWIVYWPWSVVWNVLGDFFTGIYDFLSNIYKRVCDAAIRKALSNTSNK